MLKRISILLVAVIIAPKIWSQDVDGSKITERSIETSIPFITIAPDSRAGAMGDAGVATSADVNSQYWNAAKYPFMKQEFGFAISYTPWLMGLIGDVDLNLLYLSGYRKLDDQQTISGGVRYFNLGQIQEVDNFGNLTGVTIRPHEFAVDAAYSRKFSDYLSAGLLFRFIYSDIANGSSGITSGTVSQYEAAKSFAADISVFYEKPIQISGYDANLAFGANISNIGAKIRYSENNESQFIPTNLRLGSRLSFDLDQYNSISVTLDFNKLLVPSPQFNDSIDVTDYGVIEGAFRSFGDASNGFKEEINEIMTSFGLEYWYMKQFAVRAGYFNEHESKGNRKYLTLGVGLKYNVFSLDFSYLFPTTGGRSNPLANTIRFTLGFLFE